MSKRMFALLLCLCMVLGLCACGGSAASTSVPAYDRENG